MAKILLIEDDTMLAELVLDALLSKNHIVEHVTDGLEGSERLSLYLYDLSIVDRTLPNMEGVEICKKYRAQGGDMPLLFLTGKGAVLDKTEGLDAGADDYLTKPFALPELLSRVNALLRRPTVRRDVITIGGLTLDARRGVASRENIEIKLLPKELSLLTFLMRNPGVYYTTADLLNRVWSSESDATTEAVKQTILRLRKKIDADGATTSLIINDRGLGYKFESS